MDDLVPELGAIRSTAQALKVGDGLRIPGRFKHLDSAQSAVASSQFSWIFRSNPTVLRFVPTSLPLDLNKGNHNFFQRDASVRHGALGLPNERQALRGDQGEVVIHNFEWLPCRKTVHHADEGQLIGKPELIVGPPAAVHLPEVFRREGGVLNDSFPQLSASLRVRLHGVVP